MSKGFTRRRFLAISAVAASSLDAPGHTAAPPLVVWQGGALGAMASIRLAHPDPDEARRLLAACVAEIRRQEAIFSLYRADSAISRLNADGALDAPPLELVELLGRSAGFSELTDGAFDVTVQPLFRRYALHFAQTGADPAGPPVDDLLDLIGWRGVQLAGDRIALARPGMAITLNGIAQGYITDCVAKLLRARGMTRVLVDLGELRALGDHPDGRPWRVGIRRPGAQRPAMGVDLMDLALATSAAAASPFDATRRFNHLLDPATGRCADPSRMVTVTAPDATTADALATAFALMPDKRARAVAALLPDVRLIG
jgi:thiamine biosynthesis lipoprotein